MPCFVKESVGRNDALCTLIGDLIHVVHFRPFSTRGIIFCEFLFDYSVKQACSENRSTLKGKNVHPKESKVNPFTVDPFQKYEKFNRVSLKFFESVLIPCIVSSHTNIGFGGYAVANYLLSE